MRNNLRKLKILIADDSPAVIDGLKNLLGEFNGIEIIGEASDGKIALEMLDILKPNILILDLNMPNMNGINVLNTIREKLKDLIIIVFSINSSKYYRNKCKELGSNYFFDKTSEINLMINTISQLTK